MATSNPLGSSVVVNSVTDLVSSSTLEFMRPITIQISCSLLKPLTKFNPYFDGEHIDVFCTPSVLTSDENGRLSFTFNVPANRFRTGRRDFFLTEKDSLSTAPGDVYCKATATFTSTGIKEVYQTTNTSTTTALVEEVTRIERNVYVPQRVEKPFDVYVPVVRSGEATPGAPNYNTTPSGTENPIPSNTWAGSSESYDPRSDPLAQTFFTFDVKDGCFITSVDLFFESKSSSQPIWVELREVVNGYPASQYMAPETVSEVAAADIEVSADASVATNFAFKHPIRLLPNRDYCFVVQSRSNEYNIWGSRMGEVSNETKTVIFQQPYVGSLFKSENNSTWQPEQYDDLKFIIYKANFNTNADAIINFALNTAHTVIDGSRFSTFNNTNIAVINTQSRHGLDVGSMVDIKCSTVGTYNGVSGTLIDGTHEVIYTRGENIFAIAVDGAIFTSTGMALYEGVIREIQVDSRGSGYSTLNPPSVFINGVDKTADVTLLIQGGGIERITINGTGVLVDNAYKTAVPTVLITGGVGSGASAYALNTSRFNISVNNIYHEFAPSFAFATPANTDVVATLSTSLANYEGGVVQNYNQGKTYPVSLTENTKFDNSMLLSSVRNDVVRNANENTTIFQLRLASNNPNVSPVIDLNRTKFDFFGNLVSDLRYGRTGQVIENVLDEREFAEVVSIDIVDGGSGYTEPPTVTLVGPGMEQGTAAAQINGSGVVTAVIVTNAGKYTDIPIVSFSGTNTTPASATAAISEFNSERFSRDGFAKTRYLTKMQVLEHVSNKIKILFTAYSNQNSSVDFYVKTSLSSTSATHESNRWSYVKPTVSANRSTAPGQFIDYELETEELTPFDTFNLKIVLRTKTPWDPPIVSNYRAIVVAA